MSDIQDDIAHLKLADSSTPIGFPAVAIDRRAIKVILTSHEALQKENARLRAALERWDKQLAYKAKNQRGKNEPRR